MKSNFNKLKESDKKEWKEVKIKIPENVVALIVNYLKIDGNGKIEMGNLQLDSNDIIKMASEGE